MNTVTGALRAHIDTATLWFESTDCSGPAHLSSREDVGPEGTSVQFRPGDQTPRGDLRSFRLGGLDDKVMRSVAESRYTDGRPEDTPTVTCRPTLEANGYRHLVELPVAPATFDAPLRLVLR